LEKQKNKRVSCSSAETDFGALAQGVYEGLWMKIILDDLKIPMQLYVITSQPRALPIIQSNMIGPNILKLSDTS